MLVARVRCLCPFVPAGPTPTRPPATRATGPAPPAPGRRSNPPPARLPAHLPYAPSRAPPARRRAYAMSVRDVRPCRRLPAPRAVAPGRPGPVVGRPVGAARPRSPRRSAAIFLPPNGWHCAPGRGTSPQNAARTGLMSEIGSSVSHSKEWPTRPSRPAPTRHDPRPPRNARPHPRVTDPGLPRTTDRSSCRTTGRDRRVRRTTGPPRVGPWAPRASYRGLPRGDPPRAGAPARGEVAHGSVARRRGARSGGRTGRGGGRGAGGAAPACGFRAVPGASSPRRGLRARGRDV